MKIPKSKYRKALDKRRKNVLMMYDDLTEENPEASDYSKHNLIASRMGLTREGVRKIVMRYYQEYKEDERK